MLPDITILTSSSSSPTMPADLKFLKNNTERCIRIIGVDKADDPSAKYMVDAFYKVPTATHPEYVDRILEICHNLITLG